MFFGHFLQDYSSKKKPQTKDMDVIEAQVYLATSKRSGKNPGNYPRP